jgi:hypothetical protein
MKPTLTDKLIAYLTLLSGLAISGVAEYYSIMGLIAIYPAALTPIVIMGIVLGLGKISGTVWLKQNWEWSPFFLKAYVLPAILVLMMITSLGVFGFLSKAHSDQSLVSGDVQSKVAVYDEKIKTEKENIEANRKALKQMDEGVDQVLGRSTTETGAEKAVAMRRAQQKERIRIQNEILQSQKSITELNDARAPIAAEVRKVEAEVGPIKYIAHLFYGENPDANVLEKSVIWVTVLIVVVLDPLAVVLLLASQYSFQRFREQDSEQSIRDWVDQGRERARQLDQEPVAEGDSPLGPVVDIVPPEPTVTNINDIEPVEFKLNEQESAHNGFVAEEVAEILPKEVKTNFEGVKDPVTGEWIQTGPEFEPVDRFGIPIEEYHALLKEATMELQELGRELETKYQADNAPLTDDQISQIEQSADLELLTADNTRYTMKNPIFRNKIFLKNQEGREGYVQNEEQLASNLWAKTTGKD